MAAGEKQVKIDFDKEKLMAFLPLSISVFSIIFLIFVLILPQVNKLSTLSRQISEIKNSLSLVERGAQNLQEVKNEIAQLEKKITELEKRLPKEIETTLLIDTLKDITEEARLKFSSIEPLPQRNYELKGEEVFYIQLPIKVKLKCGIFDLIEFIHKIENSPRLMKVSELTIKNNPADAWEHDTELVISTFAAGKK